MRESGQSPVDSGQFRQRELQVAALFCLNHIHYDDVELEVSHTSPP
jgi:hypothetical protein